MGPTQEKQARIQQLKTLEQLKYSQALSEKRTAFEDKRAVIQQMSMQPAGILSAIIDAWRDFRSELVNARIDIRRELAAKEPALASERELDEVLKEIERIAWMDRQQRREKVEEFARGRSLSPAVLNAVTEHWEREDYGIIPAARNRLAQLGIEISQQLHAPMAPQMNIAINNSTVHQLNLGSVLGDMNHAVTTLSQTGHADAAKALKELTELVGATKELDVETQRQVVQNIAFVSQQATLPAHERNQGLLKASLGYVQTAAQATSALTQAWIALAPIIEGLFHR